MFFEPELFVNWPELFVNPPGWVCPAGVARGVRFGPVQDGKTSGARKALVRALRKRLGLGQFGGMVQYSKFYLTADQRLLFNNREVESLDIQFATLVVTQLLFWPVGVGTVFLARSNLLLSQARRRLSGGFS